MNYRQRLGLIILSAHLVLVILGAAGVDIHQVKFLGFPTYVLTELTGANSGFGFFAPGVGSDIRARFEVTLPSGKIVEERLQRGTTHEADLRVGNIVSKFWNEVSDENRRRALTASWAGKMLARHPGAREVKVRLDTYELPSSSDYQSGNRPAWEVYYEAKYVLR